MASWSEFAADEPRLADEIRLLLQQYGPGFGYLATVRADGGPRVHPVSPVITDEGLFCFVIDSPKRRGLERDARWRIGLRPARGRQRTANNVGHRCAPRATWPTCALTGRYPDGPDERGTMPESLLTPAPPCPTCGTPVPRRPGRGRPRRYCGTECAREADNLGRAERHAYDIGLLAGDEYVPGLDGLDRWTATYDEAADHVRDVYGPGVPIWEAFVPDDWRTTSRDDVEGVYPGDEVGRTSPGIGRVLGAHDRPDGWDRRKNK